MNIQWSVNGKKIKPSIIVPEGQEQWGTEEIAKSIRRNKGWKLSNSDGNYKKIEPQGWTNFKHMKHKERYAKTL